MPCCCDVAYTAALDAADVLQLPLLWLWAYGPVAPKADDVLEGPQVVLAFELAYMGTPPVPRGRLPRPQVLGSSAG